MDYEVTIYFHGAPLLNAVCPYPPRFVGGMCIFHNRRTGHTHMLAGDARYYQIESLPLDSGAGDGGSDAAATVPEPFTAAGPVRS